MATQNVIIYISEKFEYYIEEEHQDKRMIAENELEPAITKALVNYTEGTVVVCSDKNVPVQYVVNVIDAVNNINTEKHQNNKVILATSQKTK